MLLSRMKVKDGRLVTKDEEELENESQDSISEGAKIVVNTENHVNESAIAVTINEFDCLVRFENGDEETVPIEAVSAFESMANDESSEETNSQIAELTKNMDAARARGYDISAYQKEIARLKSMDAFTWVIEERKILSSPVNKFQYIIVNSEGKQKGVTYNSLQEAKNAMNKLIDQYLLKSKNRAVDKYTGDPLTEKGKEVMAALKEQYGEEKGEQVFYAMKNSGKIGGID